MLLSGGICSLPGLLSNPALCSNSALAKDQQTKSGFVLLCFFFSAKITLPSLVCPTQLFQGFLTVVLESCSGTGSWFGGSATLASSLRARGIYFCPAQSKVGRERHSQWAFHVVLGVCQHWKAHFGIEFFMCSYIFWLIHCSVTKLHFKLGKCISYLLYLQALQL